MIIFVYELKTSRGYLVNIFTVPPSGGALLCAMHNKKGDGRRTALFFFWLRILPLPRACVYYKQSNNIIKFIIDLLFCMATNPGPPLPRPPPGLLLVLSFAHPATKKKHNQEINHGVQLSQPITKGEEDEDQEEGQEHYERTSGAQGRRKKNTARCSNI